MKSKLEGIKQEDDNHQTHLQELVKSLSQSEGLDSKTIQESAKETEQKDSQMTETYLGKDPDSSEALEVLCLTEGR
jgi:hypothetical protein